ncbi:hypothetical protein IW140_004501 [Coemansia sp. RSA 1813]|nr:hypothetical protein EV178_004685 [Coemansia sp. RSA 1646]KAJ1771163.1 hypothetical protein LPJ74_002552 [Coemansia sp. RSA 1843]KAJ2087813.1 hypothetical protein IW138_004708 [Coemansia sp. RSA 986]KAJ2212707.1 hypothetical protein EV179_004455 [Coemansia sp. RSA 487]KAJ2567368.1 hypothetical protein IW140_004501 [Coemansia sp. RSA 1813]
MSQNSQIKVVVTGASGLLGRAVVKEAKRCGYNVIGTAFRRAAGGLVALDLTNYEATKEFIASERPNAIIHCAVEKNPQAAAANRASAELLNVTVSGQLARLAREAGAFFMYVSTEYVFDGRNPPYTEESEPNPLNFYGQTKLDGERAVLDACPAAAAVLRVPLLYGKTVDPAESTFGGIIKMLDQSRGKTVEVDAWQHRFPVCIDDVARVLVDMTAKSCSDKRADIAGVFQFAPTEMLTRYDMCVVLADILKISDVTLVPLTEQQKSDGVERPKNAQMSTGALERAGINVGYVPFRQWWSQHLGGQT